jgi:hypothetical protein
MVIICAPRVLARETASRRAMSTTRKLILAGLLAVAALGCDKASDGSAPAASKAGPHSIATTSATATTAPSLAIASLGEDFQSAVAQVETDRRRHWSGDWDYAAARWSRLEEPANPMNTGPNKVFIAACDGAWASALSDDEVDVYRDVICAVCVTEPSDADRRNHVTWRGKVFYLSKLRWVATREDPGDWTRLNESDVFYEKWLTKRDGAWTMTYNDTLLSRPTLAGGEAVAAP